ncbi:MAG: c-type cytochrome [Pseudomonadales bacterium]|nr:c-type cytochrome [Pseudomonadales bacterium]
MLLAACGTEDEALPENPTLADRFRQDPAALERGRALYEGSCAAFCHEVEGDEAVDLFDCQWRHGSTDEELFSIISNGIPDTRMVGFGENFPEGDQDTWRLVAYINNSQAQCQVE